jgi:hypothetical protein
LDHQPNPIDESAGAERLAACFSTEEEPAELSGRGSSVPVVRGGRWDLGEVATTDGGRGMCQASAADEGRPAVASKLGEKKTVFTPIN